MEYGCLSCNFWDQGNPRHHSLSVLIKNARERINDFKPYSTSFNEELLSKMDKFRQKASASAHVIEEEIRPDFFKASREDINYICNLLKVMIEKMKQTK